MGGEGRVKVLAAWVFGGVAGEYERIILRGVLAEGGFRLYLTPRLRLTRSLNKSSPFVVKTTLQ